ncbi:MAG: single-stranded-DNA-specific exonuclease RecJ [Spirochaetes bacterium]|nr:single-stranded-DNA-specific exonuclease RecJ [Spirochaetota bacterium]
MNAANSKFERIQGSVEDHSSLFGLHPVIVEILHARGINTPAVIDSFLSPRLSDMHSPYMLDGMYQAVNRLRLALEAKEKIGIFADSDLDGITSLAVLYHLLERLKITPYLRYLKDDESYGLTGEMIDEFKENGVSLVITVDSGTRDVAEIAYARSIGIDVIVTDHHEQDNELPDAIVVNPRLSASAYPFSGLAGVGVAFKLCHALLMSYLPSFKKLFILIAKESGGYSVSRIRDCIIESIERGFSRDQVDNSLTSITEDCIALVDDPILMEPLRGNNNSITIYRFLDFVNRILKTDQPSTQGICDLLGINIVIHGTGIGMLNRIFMETQLAGSDKIKEFIGSVIGLVALGTIADVVPLVGENRVIVKNGIAALNRVKHRRISALVNQDAITTRSVGWTIAPLLNTPGRMGKTELTVKFFIEKDQVVLESVIGEIKSLNESRRNFINDFCARAMDDIGTGNLDSSGGLIYIKTENIPDGFAGLIANRISDSSGKPVIVAAYPGKNGTIKGSGRSRSGMKFFSLIDGFSDRFERIGGHENAFGFTAQAESIDEIIGLVDRAMRDSGECAETALYERELELGIIDVAFINDLYRLDPFGSGNSEPIFISRQAEFESFMQFGKDHGKYSVSRGNPLAAIGWGKGDMMRKYFEDGKPIDVVYRLENNRYNGVISPRMILLDITCSSQ